MKTTIMLTFAVVLVFSVATICSAQVTIAEYPVPGGGGGLYGITKGPDGSLWFTENAGNKIGKMTTAGVVTEYPVNGNPVDITAGADGNLWFTEYFGQQIGRLTPAGVLTEFPLPSSNSFPYGITLGPDGNVWFTETGVGDGSVGPIGGNRIGKITISGVITEYAIPTADSVPEQIVTGPDGNLWFPESHANQIGKITPAGTITEYPIPNLGFGGVAITSGSDGNIWFAWYNSSAIGRINTSGGVTVFPIGTGSVNINGITKGSDGNIWFTEYRDPGTDAIARITPAGTITEFPLVNGEAYPLEITTGPDGNLWFTEYTAGNIGKVVITPATAYHSCLLYDPTKAVKAGSTIPIKLQLCTATGDNLSSPSITLTATGVALVSTAIDGPVVGAGNANADSNFRFDADLGPGYIFNLKTTGLMTGTYRLDFTISGDSAPHNVQFQVR